MRAGVIAATRPEPSCVHDSAFFTIDGAGRGTLARALMARPRDMESGKTAHLSSDRSAPDDFCVRVEVHSQRSEEHTSELQSH